MCIRDRSIIEDDDRGFFITGQSKDSTGTQSSILVAKTDAIGCIEGFPCNPVNEDIPFCQ